MNERLRGVQHMSGLRKACVRRPGSIVHTLAAGAFAAVNDRQDHWLGLPAVALQAKEAHGAPGVQPVAAAVTGSLQIGLLGDSRRRASQVVFVSVTHGCSPARVLRVGRKRTPPRFIPRRIRRASIHMQRGTESGPETVTDAPPE